MLHTLLCRRRQKGNKDETLNGKETVSSILTVNNSLELVIL